MNRFRDRIVLVTGGSSGIGLVTATAFAADGAHVIITGRDGEALAQAEKEIGRSARAIRSDASSLADLGTLIADIASAEGRIDTLFVNAGWTVPTPTHFIVSADVERSRRFYTEVLGGQAVLDGEPTIVALSNSWIIINTGGGPTQNKPTVTLQAPSDPDRVSSFLHIRVADIHAIYRQWSAGGATSLTPPAERGPEIRCYLRDPDGHLIEVGQVTGRAERRPSTP